MTTENLHDLARVTGPTNLDCTGGVYLTLHNDVLCKTLDGKPATYREEVNIYLQGTRSLQALRELIDVATESLRRLEERIAEREVQPC